ncbi:MAG: ribonuclease P protein component [Parcubacteria group bacterium]|nr:ribonuclease P protein component [Parcubacteria group bacterium]|tara:strand:- start:3307 stop:3648 length:342 start_codon:yes stop_codon:yes gene_type:complete
MLPASKRLTKDKDIKRVNKAGQSYFSPLFKLKYLANDKSLSRFTVVVSNKVSKKAVLRNRLRRQLREIIRLNLKKIKSGHDIIVSVKSQSLGKTYQDLENSLNLALKKSKLLK